MSNDAAEDMRIRLRDGLKEAMRAKDAAAVTLLRRLIGAIDNAQAVPTAPGRQPYVARSFGDVAVEVQRVQLGAADVRALFVREAEERIATAEELERHGQQAKAAELREEAARMRRYIEDERST